jgi:hypothetical protein
MAHSRMNDLLNLFVIHILAVSTLYNVLLWLVDHLLNFRGTLLIALCLPLLCQRTDLIPHAIHFFCHLSPESVILSN